MLEGGRASRHKEIEGAANVVEEVNAPLAATIFHRSLFEVMTY
jgi:hypothetical protein